MFGIQNFSVFLITALALNITPGQDTLYIIGRSIAQGRRAGIISVLGISTGSLIHTTAAAFGLSAILAVSSTAFSMIKLVGAVYLIYLGVQMLLECASSVENKFNNYTQLSVWKIYQQGILTNVLNPKVALFFLSLLPQFINDTSNMRVLAFFGLGSTFIFTGTIWCLLVAWFSAKFSRYFCEKQATGFWLKRITGVLFVGLGVKLAFEKS
ncbi:MAG: LysE family translocator [Nostoc sp. DedQUE05]|uniref:LysE family translocator n=1 Tax=Nostoc sp. DedQUE05 TaxID=3075391 RepID=UPI002AD2067A|nr:LysE family translocator [Nostoc sp. DedQUE05]MDZ8091507.1 LysE family translocator [Nostoc sp. DedQUE05]